MATRQRSKNLPAARTSSQNVVLLAPPGSAEFDPALFDDPDAARAEMPQEAVLNSLLEQLGGADYSGKVVVERQLPSREFEWLYECQPAEFSFADIQAEYGAGKYRIKVYGSRPDVPRSGIGLMSNKTYNIAAPSAKHNPHLANKVAAVAAPANQSQDVAAIVAQVLAPMKDMMAQVAGAMGNRAQFLQELQQMRTLFAPADGAVVKAPDADPFALLEKFAKFQTSLAGMNADKEVAAANPELALMQQGLSAFLEVFRESKAARAGQPALPPPPVADAQHAAPSAPQQPPNNAAADPAEQEAMTQLRNYLQITNGAARMNLGVENFAEQIYENAPDEVLAILATPVWFTELCKHEPNCAPFKEWYEKLHAEIMRLLDEERTAEAASAAPPANAAG